MKTLATFLFIRLVALAAYAQGVGDVSQLNISGSAPASVFGSPFGQSFVPTSLQPLIGVGLAVVNNAGAGDIQISLYHSDPSGSTLLGGPIISGRITAAQIDSYYTGVATPLWFPVYFDQPYAQTAGEHLAFTIEGGGALNFYYALGSSYSGGRVLADDTKDLTFTTLVPEPGTFSLFLVGAAGLFLWRFKRVERDRNSFIPNVGRRKSARRCCTAIIERPNRRAMALSGAVPNNFSSAFVHRRSCRAL